MRNDFISYFQRIKQEWGPEQWAREGFAFTAQGKHADPQLDEAATFCALGILMRVAPQYTSRLERVLEKKLREKYPDIHPQFDHWRLVPHFNDLEDGTGYEKIMSVIDDILLESAPVAPKVDERELVTA